MRTESEILFEALCKARGVKCEPIPEADGKTPDYWIWLDRTPVVVEVKQFEEGDFVRALLQLSDDPDAPAITDPADARLRNLFGRAKKQIRRFTRCRFPGVFVFYDSTHGLGGVDSLDIKHAMYGEDTVIILTRDRETRAVHVFGGKRTLTPTYNRSVSAWAELHHSGGEAPCLSLYHNEFARIPVEPELAARLASAQFTLEPGEPSQYRKWRTVHPG